MTSDTFAAVDEQRRNRIISHMNQSHARELAHYLRHYAAVPRRHAVASPSLQDVTLQGMRIHADGNDYVVPFEPPLVSWADVKARIIDMDTTAREHLGISDIFVTQFAPPEGFDCAIFAAVVFYFACVASLPWVVPGSMLYRAVAAVFPGGPDWYKWLTRLVFFPVIGIHLTETYFLNRKLQRHGVEPWSGLWWRWVSSGFIEGYPASMRVDRVVARKRAEKEGRSH
ncbi:hypothetical protein RJ55_03941 [Drechmeria coniospora]|nr:hypothetical protein RJ55_03941 [Drechmeria coniospora]